MRLEAIFRLTAMSIGVCAIFLAPQVQAKSLSSSSPSRVTIEGPSKPLALGEAKLKCTWTPRKPPSSGSGAISFGSEEATEEEEEENVSRVVWWKDGAMIFSWAAGATVETTEAPAVEGAGKAKGGKEEKRVYDESRNVQIDVERSGRDTLYLENLAVETSGSYVCDVFFGALRERSMVHSMEVVVGGSEARLAKSKGRTTTTTTTTVAPLAAEVVEVSGTPKSGRKPKAEANTNGIQGTDAILKAMLFEMVKQTKAMEGRFEVDKKTFELKKQEMEFLKGLKRSPVKT